MPEPGSQGGSVNHPAHSETEALRRRVRELEEQLAARDNRPEWRNPGPLADLWQRIEQRMGVAPAEQAQSEPAIAWALFGFAEFAYLDSPPPSLFKEQLFTYLSRFCSVRYCIARHCAFLIGKGYIAGDPECSPMDLEAVQRLVADPLPSVAGRQEYLERLAAHPGALESWPLYDSALGKEFFFACAAVMLYPDRTSAFLGQLRRLLGPVRIEQLLLFLGFIRMAHYWTEVHPTLSLEPDLEPLVREDGILAPALLRVNEEDRALRMSLTHDEPELELRQRKFHELLKASDQVIWTADAQGLMQEDSSSWCAFTGQTAAERLGSGWLDAVHPGDRQGASAAWTKAIEAQSPFATEYRLRHVSGSWRWTAVRGYPVVSPDGHVDAWVGLNVDITALKEAEAAARDSEERFRLLVDGARNTAIFALDPDGRVQSWNSGAARITGYAASEVIGRNYELLFPLADRDKQRPASLLAVAARDGEVRDRSWRVRKSGELYWADVSISARRAGDGSLLGFSDILRDLTDERNYVTALEESEERSRLLLENAAQGVIGVRSDGRIELANSTACRIFGYSADSLKGQPIELLMPEASREVHVSHRASYAAQPETRAMAVGRELSGRRASGEIFPVEVTLGSLRTANSVLHVAFVTDITERKRNHLALRESMERFRLLSENVPELVWTCQPGGQCDYLNQRWVDYTGIPAEQQLGYGWLERVHPADREATISAWQAAVASQKPLDVEFRIRRHDGVYRWFRTRASALRNQEGDIVKWFGSNTDVHDLRMAMQELETVNAELESFAYIAAHDMQEPLRTAVSFTQLLERHLDGKLDERGLALMGHVRNAARRMSQLFSDLLKYTEAGANTREDGTADLNACAALAISNLQSTIREGSARVEVLGALPTVRGSESQFVQIFQNLIGNAIKYRGAHDPEIRITGETHATHGVVRIADNGIGIEPRDHETVFKIFKRLHGAETEGTGIGLSICQRIVTRYGGRIWVESAGLHQGSTFVFELPINH
ncbi:MAG: PAS domain S-box protein [Bryobacteraceae bacterium]